METNHATISCLLTVRIFLLLLLSKPFRYRLYLKFNGAFIVLTIIHTITVLWGLSQGVSFFFFFFNNYRSLCWSRAWWLDWHAVFLFCHKTIVFLLLWYLLKATVIERYILREKKFSHLCIKTSSGANFHWCAWESVWIISVHVKWVCMATFSSFCVSNCGPSPLKSLWFLQPKITVYMWQLCTKACLLCSSSFVADGTISCRQRI